MPRIWLVLPTFCEAGNIERIVLAACGQLEVLAPAEYRLLIVDDASPDGTAEIADRLATELPTIEVLNRGGKRGLGRAYLAGFERALAEGAELVIVMDADFSHDPAHLPALLEAATHSDLVLGSRYVPGGRVIDWPPLRRLLSRAGSLYARSILGVDVRDLTGGFRSIRREVLEAVELPTLRSQGYVFNIELTYRALRAGFCVTEVPILFHDRTVGESKISLSIAIEALSLVPVLRFPWLASRWPARKVPLARQGNGARSVRPLAGAVAEQRRQPPQARNDQNLYQHVAGEIRQPAELAYGAQRELDTR
jgi:dolichol-phosphate mannosyltransferase